MEGGTVKVFVTLAALCVLLQNVLRVRAAVSFGRPLYQVTVDEELPVSSSIVQTQVLVNGFPAAPGTVSYSVSGGADPGFFQVDSRGEVQVGQRMDREMKLIFRCVVRVIDVTDGSWASSDVEVTLQDVNDNAPRFSQRGYSINVAEASAGRVIFNASAVDADQVVRVPKTQKDSNGRTVIVGYTYTVDNGRVLYSIASGNQMNHFTINRDNGSVTVAPGAQLNVEKLSFYQLAINASDPHGLSTTAQLNITVVDSNDNAPVIYKPKPFSLNISESTPKGFEILKEAFANDTDHGINAQVHFMLKSGSPNGEFSVNPSTGRIVVSGSLDRDTTPVIHLVLAAVDGGVPSLESTVTITIYLSDVNDSPPQFTSASYIASVSEAALISTSVTTVTAIDPDAPGPGSDVRYSLQNTGKGHFSVDPISGLIRTAQNLDRETTARYDLIVVATDQDLNPAKRLSSQVVVTVLIGDVNDNPPVFSSSPIIGGLLENAVPSAVAVTLSATDADAGTNAALSYAIFGTDSSVFSVNSGSGIVRFTGAPGSLNYAVKRFYNLTARVRDSAGRYSDADLYIEVHQINIHHPKFVQSTYTTNISEALPVGKSVLTVTATDKDAAEIGRIQYFVIRDPGLFDVGGSLDVVPETGVVYVNTSLDRDIRSVIRFRILASDGGFPQPYSDETNVTIYLEDVNDTPPQFPAKMISSVTEHRPNGSFSVFVVSAHDPDLGNGSIFRYHLKQGIWPAGLFTIDSVTGNLTIHYGVDRETTPQFNVTVIAIDEGTPRQTGSGVVRVDVMDINDKPPYFITNYTVSVSENTTIGTTILVVSALDDDIGNNAKSSYSILSGNTLGHFFIDTTSGAVTVAGLLDRERWSNYSLRVKAVDNAGYSTTVWAFIAVMDVNDNSPLFRNSTTTVHVSESLQVGSIAWQVTASDADIGTNAIISYDLAAIHNTSAVLSYFQINSTTSAVTLLKRLDRETMKNFSALLVANDSLLYSNTTLNIQVVDYNDVIPAFEHSLYTAHVSENITRGVSIVAVSATDGDVQGHNQELQYQILAGDAFSWFTINPVSGIISAQASLDRERAPVTNITVGAVNKAPPHLTGNTTVSISLEDINDNPPDFGTSRIVISVKENEPIGTTVGYISAIDRDIYNSTVWYGIVRDNAFFRLKINATTGLVTTNAVFDREKEQQFWMLVEGADQGLPPLSSMTNASVIILDTNDNKPVFGQDAYKASISEEAKNGTHVLTVSAVDVDNGNNAQIRYSLGRTLNTASHPFIIDSISGVIKTSQSLDREKQASYLIEVIAKDLGIPPQSSVVTMTVLISDINDNFPVFANTSYRTSMRESLAVGSAVIRVTATDSDEGPDGYIEYSLVSSSDSAKFNVTRDTGVIYAVAYLDREVQAKYTLQLVANNSASPRPVSVTAAVVIDILDVNDNVPHLSSLVSEMRISEDTPVGSITGRVPFIDGDEGRNGSVNITLLRGDDNRMFAINSSTGEVELLKALDFESQAFYSLYLSMSDAATSSLTSVGTLNIIVDDANDHRPSFLLSRYEQTVSHTALISDDVITLMAEDQDTVAGSFQYTIISDNSSGLFQVTSLSSGDGVIRVAQLLQGNVGRVFRIVIQVNDSRYTAKTEVILFITNLAAGSANFPSSQNSFLVSELQTQGNTVAQVLTTGGSVSVAASSAPDFTVTAAGGIIVKNTLDYHRTKHYDLVLRLSAAGGSDRYAQARIIIQNTNNKFSPSFPTKKYTFSVPEETSLNTVVGRLNAFDKDDPQSDSGRIFYSISQESTVGQFAIDSRGALLLQRGLDYESGPRTYSLVVTARNTQSSSQLSTTASIDIVVTESNDITPRFTLPRFVIQLSESRSISPNPVVSPTAVDADSGSNGDLTFSLAADTLNGGTYDYTTFSVDTYSGTVIQTGPLDRETHDGYNLLLRVSDGGNPPRTATAAVSIQILDINDNSPVWGQPSYYLTLYENQTLSTRLLTVHATDRDQVDAIRDSTGRVIGYRVRNGLVRYSIAGGDASNQFAVDAVTGVLSLQSTLDRETIPSYNITLRATDGGGRFTNTYLTVTVLDNNDNPPVFQQLVYSGSVAENAPEGVSIIEINAVDPDIKGPHSQVYYTIAAGNMNSTFEINTTTGEISTNGKLDREVTPHYNLTVLASDRGRVSQTSTAAVLINLIDINEFPPAFSHSLYSAAISEASPAGFSVDQVTTSDPDFGPNSTSSFSIIGGDFGHFIINSTSGVVSVSGVLDFESRKSYNLTVKAEDNAPPSARLSSTSTVKVNLLDANDNSPQFRQTSYSVNVSETAHAGSLLINITATDEDSGKFAQVHYQLSFSKSDDSAQKFAVSSATGTVSLTGMLDRELYSLYTLTVSAIDGGGRLTTTSLLVNVIDENDNPPAFNSTSYSTVISEDISPGTLVLRPTATDRDINLNSLLSYSLLEPKNLTTCQRECPHFGSACLTSFEKLPSGFSSRYFSINQQNGVTLTIARLDRELMPLHIVKLIATDSSISSPRLQGTACTVFNISDINDNDPAFLNSSYTFKIAEAKPLRSTVGTVKASDVDTGVNADLTYRLLNSSSGHLFDVDSQTGRITSQVVFNREVADMFQLTAEVRDSGVPQRMAVVNITITVTDINDNVPLFIFSNTTLGYYTASVYENERAQLTVLTVNTTDADIGANGAVTVSLLTNPHGHFNITAEGQLDALVSLDREAVTEYDLTIQATDHGFPSQSSTTKVHISVLDRNDNAPRFTQDMYSASLAENSSILTIISQVFATDADVGSNAALRFAIASSEHTSLFDIDAMTGIVRLASLLDFEQQPDYILNISVMDSSLTDPQLTSQTVLNISVLDVNDNAPVFSSSHYQVPLTEATQVNTSVTTVTATDRDATEENSEVSYSLEPNSFFAINSSTGSLLLLQSLDREDQPQHTLVVTATDSGIPALSSTTRVTIFVLDINDNFPVFEQQEYQFSVVENLPGGTYAGQVLAHDVDKDKIQYRIENDTSGGSFQINATSGDLTTTQALDREENDTHILFVFADDGIAIRSASSLTRVFITVIDRNDVTPQFIAPQTYHVPVSELLATGKGFFVVRAVDEDVGFNAQLSYRLLPANDSEKFQINSTSGEVSLRLLLDFETQQSFSFMVEVADAGLPQLISTALFNVSVLDENDNTPVFQKTSYNATVNEDRAVGTTLLQVHASDADSTSNANIQFSITNGNTGGDFIVNASSGDISIGKSLDYERTRSYHLVVRASDLGMPSRNSSTLVHIGVIDLNDNAPMFANSTYMFSVLEASPPLALISILSASDQDDTTNAQLRYYFSSGNSDSRFALDEISGALRSLVVLDAERFTAPLTLTVTAADQGMVKRTGTALVRINVLDVNDNRPQFLQRQFSVSAQSNSKAGTSLFRLPATDQDRGMNAEPTFNLTYGDASRLITLNQTSGVISAAQDLASLSGVYYFTMSVQDGGIPRLSDSCLVKLVVKKTNSHSPHFLLTQQSVTVSPQEIIGSTIAFAVANDIDYSLTNPGLTYSLKPSSIAVTGNFFEVNRRSGHVAVSKSLHPLANTKTFIEVCATDSALATCQFINITVSASATNAFPQPSYTFTVSEWAPVGSHIGLIHHPGAAKYIAKDFTLPAAVSILGNGTIVVSRTLDFETQNKRILTVSALNKAQQAIATVAVLVSLIDENDFQPVFSTSHLEVTIPETTFPGTSIVSISASDADGSSSQSSVSYSIMSGNELGWFWLDPNSGALRTRQLIDREASARVTLNITAVNIYSSRRLRGFMSLSVVIADTNDNPPTFEKTTYHLSLSENTAIKTSVLTLRASDPDSGYNSMLYYSLVYASKPGLFSVNQKTGQLFTLQALNSTATPGVTLTITAGDFGSPVPQQRSTHVFITVAAVNKQPPVFSQPSYTAKASETAPVGTLLLVVQAQDPDGDRLAIRFHLTQPSGEFDLDDISGALTLRRTLNHTVSSSYLLKVMAKDSGNPTLNSTVPVQVLVTDENNHSPVFSSRSYELSLSEFTPVGTVIISFRVFDPDAKFITFSISKNARSPLGGDLFAINSTTGDLLLVRSLDYESQKSYDIEVAAVDGGYSLRRSTRQKLKIFAVDENDNRPVFTSIPQHLNVSRFFPRNYTLTNIAATDKDEFHSNIFFEILSGDVDDLFSINNLTGRITIAKQPGASANRSYTLTVGASDGLFVTTAIIDVDIDYWGNFCTDAVCYRTQPALSVCSGISSCSATCPSKWWVCAPVNSTNGTCVPLHQPCEHRCNATHSLCEPTQLCLPLTTSSTCDNSSTTCLVDQALVEFSNGSRACQAAHGLPSTVGRQCTKDGTVFCSQRNRCINVAISNPCVPCLPPLKECPVTGVCEEDQSHCCSSTSEIYCNYTQRCQNASQPCALLPTVIPNATANTAPQLYTQVVYMGAVSRDNNNSTRELLSNGVWLGQILKTSSLPGNGIFASDVDNDTLGVAVFEAGGSPTSWWEIAQCQPVEHMNGMKKIVLTCDSITSPWQPLPRDMSALSAALLSPTVRMRPTVTDASRGSIWLRAHAWDGSRGNIRNAYPNATLEVGVAQQPILSTGGSSPFSADSFVLLAVVHPAMEYPFVREAVKLHPLLEDTPTFENFGTVVSSALQDPILTRLDLISESVVADLPAHPAARTTYQSLLPPPDLNTYFSEVRRVNAITSKRLVALAAGSQPGLAIVIPAKSSLGRWQVSPVGNLSTWYYMDKLGGTLSAVLVPARARLRFVPADNYYGEPAPLLAYSWDGVTTGSDTQTVSELHAVKIDAVSRPQLSATSISRSTSVSIIVSNHDDRPVLTTNRTALNAVPYRIRYHWDHLFTVTISRSINNFCQSRDSFVAFMLLVLQKNITIRHVQPVTTTSIDVSFEVSNNVLPFDALAHQIQVRLSQLATLQFKITNIRDDAAVGAGPSCSSSTQLTAVNDGTPVAVLLGNAGTDADGTLLGAAIVRTPTHASGTWQYWRYDLHTTAGDSLQAMASQNHSSLSRSEQIRQHVLKAASEVNVTRHDLWLTFPANLTTKRSFLLHPLDRIRFVPYPGFYWPASSHLVPHISMRAWDIRLGGKAGQLNVNTDCYIVTSNASGQLPCEAFSQQTMRASAMRVGCDGISGSGKVHDTCCVCGGTGTTCSSTKVFGACDVCGAAVQSTACLGCDSIPFSRSTVDDCGVCRGNRTSRDCHGDCFGSALKDECNMCTEGNTGQLYNGVKDCAGVCNGMARRDSCNDCTGPATNLTFNQRLDCTGVCGGPFRRDPWCNLCQDMSQKALTDHRDCAGACFGTARRDSCGVCYGGRLSTVINSTVDQCGVCGGHDKTCTGCDGRVASGHVIDRCGVCNGHDCGCLKIHNMSPLSGPATGGTRITIHGAGFFYNNSNLPAFDAAGNFRPNCGGIVRHPTGEYVQSKCIFQVSQQQFLGVSKLLDHRTMECTAPDSTTFQQQRSQFKVTVQIGQGPVSVAEDIDASYTFIDISTSLVLSLSPREALTTSTTTVIVHGQNLPAAPDAHCLLQNAQACKLKSSFFSPDGYVKVAATFINSTSYRCFLPSVGVSCQVQVYLSIDGQASGRIKSSTGQPHLFTFFRSSPVITFAQFTDGGTALIVKWDRPVTLATGSLSSCDQVWDSATLLQLGGVSSTCQWSSDAQTAVHILLSHSANITIGSKMAVRSSSLVTRHEKFSYAASLNSISVASLSPTSTTQSPQAIIKGPSEIPSCGTVTFVGRFSNGSGYGAVSYIWSVAVDDAQAAGFKSLQAGIASQAPHSHQIILNSNLFRSNIVYHLRLKVTNIFGKTSPMTQHRLTLASTPVPSVEISGPPQRRVVVGSEAVFQSVVRAASCSRLQTVTRRWELWKLSRGAPEVDELVPVLGAITNSSSFILNSSSLETGRHYRLRVHTTVGVDSSMFHATSDVLLTAVPAKLVARIRGGNCNISANKELLLDAGVSLDGTPLANEGTIFRWWCYHGQLACKDSPKVNSFSLSSTSQQVVPAQSLSAGESFIFRVEVTRGQRQAHTQTTVRVTTSLLPQLEITPAPRANVNSKLVLEAWVTLPQLSANSVITWSPSTENGFTALNLSSDGIAKTNTVYYQRQTSTSLSRQVSIPTGTRWRVPLVLSPYVLRDGLKYRFNLTVNTQHGKASAFTDVITNSAPSSGVLRVTKTAVQSSNPLFQLDAVGWQDEEGDTPLLYRFGFRSSNTGKILWLSEKRSDPTFITTLPQRKLSSHKVTVVSEVYDSLGAVSAYSVDVTMSLSGRDIISQLTNAMANAQQSSMEHWSVGLSRLVVGAAEAVADGTSASEAKRFVTSSLAFMEKLLRSEIPAESSARELTLQLLDQIVSLTMFKQQQELQTVLDIMETLLNSLTPRLSLSADLPSSSSSSSSSTSLLSYNHMYSTRWLRSEQISQVMNIYSHLSATASSGQEQVRVAVRQASEQIASDLCQSLTYSESPSHVLSPVMDFTVEYTNPSTDFCPGKSCSASSPAVDYGQELAAEFDSWACGNPDGTRCHGVCTMTGWNKEISAAAATVTLARLSTSTANLLTTNFPGSNLSVVTLQSTPVTASLLHPLTGAVFKVATLAQPVRIKLPLLPDRRNGTLLCGYQQVGGQHGYSVSDEWSVESLQPATLITDNATSMVKALCNYTHLTVFSVLVVPPPTPTTPPPTTIPTTTPTTAAMTALPISTTLPVTTTARRPTTSPTVITPGAVSSGSNAGTIAAVVVVIILLFIIGLLIYYFFVYRKRKLSHKINIADSSNIGEGIQLQSLKDRPLSGVMTDDTKQLVQVILLKDNERTSIGETRILTSIRLRELRNILCECFEEQLKSKPFYFLTRDFCNIEPSMEQMQFVSTVYEKSVFFRYALAENSDPAQFHLHFCICGSAAQFECSECSSRGYCSTECQHLHWKDVHKDECSRLAEQRSRKEILRRHHSFSKGGTSGIGRASSAMTNTPRRLGRTNTWGNFLEGRRTLSGSTLPGVLPQMPPAASTKQPDYDSKETEASQQQAAHQENGSVLLPEATDRDQPCPDDEKALLSSDNETPATTQSPTTTPRSPTSPARPSRQYSFAYGSGRFASRIASRRSSLQPLSLQHQSPQQSSNDVAVSSTSPTSPSRSLGESRASTFRSGQFPSKAASRQPSSQALPLQEQDKQQDYDNAVQSPTMSGSPSERDSRASTTLPSPTSEQLADEHSALLEQKAAGSFRRRFSVDAPQAQFSGAAALRRASLPTTSLQHRPLLFNRGASRQDYTSHGRNVLPPINDESHTPAAPPPSAASTAPSVSSRPAFQQTMRTPLASGEFDAPSAVYQELPQDPLDAQADEVVFHRLPSSKPPPQSRPMSQTLSLQSLTPDVPTGSMAVMSRQRSVDLQPLLEELATSKDTPNDSQNAVSHPEAIEEGDEENLRDDPDYV